MTTKELELMKKVCILEDKGEPNEKYLYDLKKIIGGVYIGKKLLLDFQADDHTVKYVIIIDDGDIKEINSQEEMEEYLKKKHPELSEYEPWKRDSLAIRCRILAVLDNNNNICYKIDEEYKYYHFMMIDDIAINIKLSTINIVDNKIEIVQQLFSTDDYK